MEEGEGRWTMGGGNFAGLGYNVAMRYLMLPIVVGLLALTVPLRASDPVIAPTWMRFEGNVDRLGVSLDHGGVFGTPLRWRSFFLSDVSDRDFGESWTIGFGVAIPLLRVGFFNLEGIGGWAGNPSGDFWSSGSWGVGVSLNIRF